MASIPVTLRGVVYDGMGPVGPYETGQEVTFVGLMNFTDLSVGGGPIVPPEQPPSGGPPGTPAFPIWGPPGVDFPDKPGYPPVVGGGPIIPDTPPVPPDGPIMVVPPSDVPGWGWQIQYGWGYATGLGSIWDGWTKAVNPEHIPILPDAIPPSPGDGWGWHPIYGYIWFPGVGVGGRPPNPNEPPPFP